MKKTILLLLLGSSLFANAQLNLVGSFNNSSIGTFHKIDGEPHISEITGNTLKLYNSNLNIVNQITIQSRTGSTFQYVSIASKGAITTDGKICYAVVYFPSISVVIYDQSGNILHEQVGASYINLLNGSPARLAITTQSQTFIYSLPGTVSLADQEPAAKLQALPFPNPVGDYITLPSAGLNIYNSLGQWELKGDSQRVDVRILLPGVYYYEGGSFVKE